MKEVFSCVNKLVEYAQQKLGLDSRNALYARNTVLGVLGVESYADDGAASYSGETCAQLLRELMAASVRAGLVEEYEGERVTDSVMGALMLSPADLQDEFARQMQVSTAQATEWLYDYSVASDYVKKEKLDQNPRFDAANGLIITINKAKPEFRDPKKAASGNSTKGGYPKCTICRENEGFFGRNKRTLRTVPLKLGDEDWFWQFSPYGYFYQHGIAVNCNHTPMHVDRNTFIQLMDFVDLFPHYFIGCNATLPRIGGSVLAHDHYQGGGETLPLHRASVAIPMKHRDFPDCKVGVLDWAGTTVRIVSKNREQIADLCEVIREAWCSYENKELGIIPLDEEGIHSAVSPTVIKTEEGYEINLILRNNITTEEYPDGVFHAHPEFHIIKKESIGLIEAQGLFILPGRLEAQMGELEKLLVSGGDLPEELAEFAMIFEEMKAMRETFTAEQAAQAVKDELASVCERILDNTAVFKTHSQTAEFLKLKGFEND